MTMVDVLRQNPEIPHGPIAIGFTSDEEIGIGIDTFDVDGFGAMFAYTVDGDTLGEINDETWSARLATVTFRGESTHPGTAKGVMVNSIYALGDFVTRCRRTCYRRRPRAASASCTRTPARRCRDLDAQGPPARFRPRWPERLDAKERLVRRSRRRPRRVAPASAFTSRSSSNTGT